MAKRTLDTVWQQIDKLHTQAVEGKKPLHECQAALEDLLAKPDVKEIVQDLGKLFFADYENFQSEVELIFQLAGDDPRFVRTTWFDAKYKKLYLDPFRVLDFIRQCRRLKENIAADGNLGNFEAYRKNSFMAELAKLPPKCILFINILQQMAITDGLTHIGLTANEQGRIEDTPYYQTLLWAFTQLEKKLYQVNGIQVRTHYGFIWHESEWIGGN